MKKSTIAIVLGWILVAMQIMALMGSNLDSGFAQLSLFGFVGFFLPGVLGIVLLWRGYKKKSQRKENKSDVKPDSVDAIMTKIRAELTGDPTKDRAFLTHQIQFYGNHPMAEEIIGGCAELLANTLSSDELNEWGQAMKADDERLHNCEPQEKQTRIHADNAQMEQEKSEHKPKSTPIQSEAVLPQSYLEILLSGMRDYQTGSGNPFVLNRIVLGMIETPLYFVVDMEQYQGVGKPDIGYIIENSRRFPVLNNLIVALPRNDNTPTENTSVKAISLNLEEYIPILAEKNESLLLLDPVEGNPVVVSPEMIRTLLLPCAREKLEEKAAAQSLVIENNGPVNLLLWQAQDVDISDGVKLHVAPGEEAVAIVDGTAEYFFQNGTHELSSKIYPLLFEHFGSGDVGTIFFVRKEKSIAFSWKKSSPSQISIQRRIYANGTCEIRISDTAAFFDHCIQGHSIPNTNDEMEHFLRLMIEEPLEQVLTSAFCAFGRSIRRIKEEKDYYVWKVHSLMNEAIAPLGLAILSFTIDGLTVSAKSTRDKEEIHRERRIVSGTEDDPEFEIQTVCYDDGSRSEMIHDHIENRAEIWERDADGNEMRTYGTFEEYEPMSDEEFTRLTREFLERYQNPDIR